MNSLIDGKEGEGLRLLLGEFDNLAMELRANLVEAYKDHITAEDVLAARDCNKHARKGPATPASVRHLVATHLLRDLYETISEEAGAFSVANAYLNNYNFLCGREIIPAMLDENQQFRNLVFSVFDELNKLYRESRKKANYLPLRKRRQK